MPSLERPRLLLHAFSTFKAGGPQVRFVQLANAFGPSYKHLILAMDGSYEAADRLGPEVDWAPLDLPNRRGGALDNRTRYRQALKEIRPDLLLTYNWGAIEWMAANVPGVVPQVHVEDGFRPDEVARQLPRRLWARRVLFAASRARVLVPSQTLDRVAASWWVPHSRLAFVPNGVDLPAPTMAPKDLNPPLVIGTVAALRAEKNLPRLLRAVAALRNRYPLRLLIVGDGPERGALEGQCVALGLADITEFTGYLAAPTQALARMDLFALSSDTEQLPIAMLEAMAHGVPVVATAVGDVPTLMPECALAALSAVEDKAFTETLERVLALQKSWPDWSRAGRQVVDSRYRSEHMVARWRAVFDGKWPPGVAA